MAVETFTDDPLQAWQCHVAPLKGHGQRIRALEKLLRVSERRLPDAAFRAACAALLGGGCAGALLEAAAARGAPDATALHSEALVLLQRMLQCNAAACRASCHAGWFRRLLLLSLDGIDAVCAGDCVGLSLEGTIASFACVNMVLRVSEDAQDVSCREFRVFKTLKALFDKATQPLGLYEALAPQVLGEMAIEALTHLATPKCTTDLEVEAAAASGRCAVCLNDCTGFTLELWHCDFCHQALHDMCAGEWLADWRRCPYCRALYLPPLEAQLLLPPEQLLGLLDTERVAASPSLSFSVCLLLVHLATARGEAEALEALMLGRLGFLTSLAHACEAAWLRVEWPERSGSFPLLWRLAITIEQLARWGYGPHLEPCLRPIIGALCAEGEDIIPEGERCWLRRAVVAFSAAGARQKALVEELLHEKPDSSELITVEDDDDALIFDELRRVVTPSIADISLAELAV